MSSLGRPSSRRDVQQWWYNAYADFGRIPLAAPVVLRLMKLYEAVQEFMTWRKQRGAAAPTVIQNESNLRQFSIFARNCDLAMVTEGVVLEYLSLLKDEFKIQNNSLIPKVNALRQFFKYWNERGVGTMSYHRIPLQKKEFNFPKLCTHEEFQKFWIEVSKPSDDSRRIRNAAIVSLIAATGIRNGEACALLLERTDVMNGVAIGEGLMFQATIKTEKTRGMKPFREIFWNQEVNEVLRRWVTRRQEIHERHPFLNPDLLFLGLNSKFGEAGWGKKLTPNAVDEIFKRYSKMAGVDVKPHMLRHMLGRDMAEGDASDHVISDVLGHSRLDSSRIYTRLFGKAVGKQFARFRGGSLSPVVGMLPNQSEKPT